MGGAMGSLARCSEGVASSVAKRVSLALTIDWRLRRHTRHTCAVALFCLMVLGARSHAQTTDTLSPTATTGAQAGTSIAAPCRIDDLDGVPWCRMCGWVANQPRLIRRVEPNLAHVSAPHPSGVVVLEIGVDETGTVRAACVSRGVGTEVDASVLRAVLAWKYAPATVKKLGLPGRKLGDAVRVVITTTAVVH